MGDKDGHTERDTEGEWRQRETDRERKIQRGGGDKERQTQRES